MNKIAYEALVTADSDIHICVGNEYQKYKELTVCNVCNKDLEGKNYIIREWMINNVRGNWIRTCSERCHVLSKLQTI